MQRLNLGQRHGRFPLAGQSANGRTAWHSRALSQPPPTKGLATRSRRKCQRPKLALSRPASALWLQVQIQFNSGVTPHQFTSEADILAAAKAGQITVINTGEVYRDSV